MCNIWQIENPAELPIPALRNLSPALRYLNLSGGEPFLRDDIAEIVRVINETAPKAQIIISSNGFATETIIKRMEEIRAIDPRVGIRISLDGIGEMHAEVRGIPGAFDMVMKTVAELKRIGVTNLGFSFTIMDKNVHQLKEVYDLSQKMGIELALAVVQNSDIYFQKADNKVTYIDELKKSLDYVIDSELRTWSPKHWGRAFYDYGLLLYATEEKRLLPSGAGFDSLFIDPSGYVYPSNLINLNMGNICVRELDEIWQGQEAEAVREKIKNENITESWIICTIRGEMKKHLLKAGLWAVVNKVRVMVGK
jgi:MoaA/NifB/PqqE/SkfB family radical SAM enzyme